MGWDENGRGCRGRETDGDEHEPGSEALSTTSSYTPKRHVQ